MSSKDGVFQQIEDAKLPDVKVIVSGQFTVSIVQMLQDQAQMVMQGKMKAEQFYKSLDNIEIAVNFFRNVSMIKEEDDVIEKGEYGRYRRYQW